MHYGGGESVVGGARVLAVVGCQGVEGGGTLGVHASAVVNVVGTGRGRQVHKGAAALALVGCRRPPVPSWHSK